MKYRVLDVSGVVMETELDARTPEDAAQLVIGHRLVRGTTGGNILRAKVYWTSANEQLTLVKLYEPKDLNETAA